MSGFLSETYSNVSKLSVNSCILLQHCLDLRNYSTMMAIVMAGLGSAPIRRLHRTWEGVSKVHIEMFKQMDTILESKVGGA